MYKYFFKRLIDFIIVFCVLVVIWPILLIITLWLHFANKGAGAFFAQERPGKGGKVFKVIKFKTMTDERDADGNLLPDADRLTNVGRFVRSTSIDELPQLINVLKGDMALIGPRPLLVQYLPLYSKEQARRHDVRPGITGWAQVNGRNAISWTKKFELDVWYVDHCSFWLDVKIIFLTIKKVFVREGIHKRDRQRWNFLREIINYNDEYQYLNHLRRKAGYTDKAVSRNIETFLSRSKGVHDRYESCDGSCRDCFRRVYNCTEGNRFRLYRNVADNM